MMELFQQYNVEFVSSTEKVDTSIPMGWAMLNICIVFAQLEWETIQKLMNNMKIQSARKVTHTWLAGKIKGGNCRYALMSINNPVGKQYLRCTKRLDNKSCPGCGKIITFGSLNITWKI